MYLFLYILELERNIDATRQVYHGPYEEQSFDFHNTSSNNPKPIPCKQVQSSKQHEVGNALDVNVPTQMHENVECKEVPDELQRQAAIHMEHDKLVCRSNTLAETNNRKDCSVPREHSELHVKNPGAAAFPLDHESSNNSCDPPCLSSRSDQNGLDQNGLDSDSNRTNADESVDEHVQVTNILSEFQIKHDYPQFVNGKLRVESVFDERGGHITLPSLHVALSIPPGAIKQG